MLGVALPRALGASLQGAELERQAEGIVVLESRIEVAEGERDAAREAMQGMTPRPGLPPGMALPGQLGPEGTAKFMAALTKHRWCWHPPLVSGVPHIAPRSAYADAHVAVTADLHPL